VGVDALSYRDRLTLETTRSIREDYLHQNAYHEVDTYTSLEKQKKMLGLILLFHDLAVSALDVGVFFNDIVALSVREQIGRAKYIPEDRLAEFDAIERAVKDSIGRLLAQGGFDNA
jgi:V/A-type H+-transporting ATPase subunit A